MNDRNLIQQAVVTDRNGLLPHPVSYAQAATAPLPMTAQALRRGGYREMRYHRPGRSVQGANMSVIC